MADDRQETVLIIDDDENIRAGLAAVLDLEDYQVLEAPHGIYGLKLLEMRPIDILVTDLNMPHKQGCETIIEARRRWPNLKIVAMSGATSAFSEGDNENSLEYARTVGADSLLTKPFTPGALLTALAEIATREVAN